MKKIIVLICFTCISLSTLAQRIARGPLHSSDNMRKEWLLPGDTLYYIGKAPCIYKGKPHLLPTEETDRPNQADTVFNGLHKGINASVNLSAFATFGKDTPHHGGFMQSINAAYLTPITHDAKLWGAAGIFFNNTTWGGNTYHDIGLYGMIGYKVNNKLELYAYTQLSIANNYNARLYNPTIFPYRWRGYTPVPLYTNLGYGYSPGGNIIGFGAKYNFSPSFYIQIDVQHAWYNNTPRYFYDSRHNYPCPTP